MLKLRLNVCMILLVTDGSSCLDVLNFLISNFRIWGNRFSMHQWRIKTFVSRNNQARGWFSCGLGFKSPTVIHLSCILISVACGRMLCLSSVNRVWVISGIRIRDQKKEKKKTKRSEGKRMNETLLKATGGWLKEQEIIEVN